MAVLMLDRVVFKIKNTEWGKIKIHRKNGLIKSKVCQKNTIGKIFMNQTNS